MIQNNRFQTVLSGLFLGTVMMMGAVSAQADNGKVSITGFEMKAGGTNTNVSVNITPPDNSAGFQYSAFNFKLTASEGLTISNVKANDSLSAGTFVTNPEDGGSEVVLLWFADDDGNKSKAYDVLNGIVTFDVTADATAETSKTQTITISEVVFSSQNGQEISGFDSSSSCSVTLDFGEMSDGNVTVEPEDRDDDDPDDEDPDDPTKDKDGDHKRTSDEIYVEETVKYSVSLDESVAVNDLTWTLSEGNEYVDIQQDQEHGVSVTGKAFGTAKLQLSSEFYQYTKDITVNVIPMPVKAVSITVPGDVTVDELKAGDEFTLTATVSPEKKFTGDITFSWSSDPEDVAGITSEGKVTALKVGDAVITVTANYTDSKATELYGDNLKKQTLELTVIPLEEDDVEIDITPEPGDDDDDEDDPGIKDGKIQLVVGEEKELSIDIRPSEDAIGEHTVTWTSSDSQTVSVDGNGKIKAEKYSEDEVTITVTVEYDTDKSVTGEIKVQVLPKEITGITITGVSLSGETDPRDLKETEWIYLTAEITPPDATFQTLNWTVDKENILDFDFTNINTTEQYQDNDNHLKVTVKIKENVSGDDITIYAATTQQPDMKGSYSISSIVDALLGDANDDGKINSADIITVRNEILKGDDEPSINVSFSFVNADVMPDKKIDVTDQTAITNLVLGKPAFPEEGTFSNIAKPSLNDRIVLGDFQPLTNGVSRVGVSLDNASAYVILQADVTLPECTELLDIEAGPQAVRHNLSYNRIGENKYRVVIYSMNNDTFSNIEDNLFSLKVSEGTAGKDVMIDSIITADSYVNKYTLEATGGQNPGSAAVEGIQTGNARISGEHGFISIVNAAGKNVSVYNIDGRLMISKSLSSDCETITVAKGIYVVSLDGVTVKVTVK